MKNYLKLNLEALERLNPMLAKLIKEDDTKLPFLEVKTNTDGFINLFIHKPNKVYTAYGVSNQEENIKNEAKKQSLFKDGGSLIIGMGLGHFVYELCKEKEKGHVIVVVETIPALIKEAFHIYNFVEYIQNGSLLFACPDDIELQMVMGLIESNCVIQDWNIISEPYTNYLPDRYSSITIYASDLINQIRCNVGTVMGNGKIIAQNDIKNLPYILSSWGIEKFKDIYKNKPAVIVSTGPSLRKNIHLLKNNRERFIIICVAQALRILLSYDITPDFACTVDFGEVNYEHFKGIMNCGIPLVALNRAYFKILQEWKGPKIICTSPAVMDPRTTMSFLAEYGNVEQGGSVSHMAVGVALKLGCNPIILTGQDLAYENNLSHNPNADASGTVKINQDGLIKWEVDDPKSLLRGQECIMGVVQEVPGYVDNVVQTNIGLLSFITSFKHIFERYKEITFINSTEGGADLQGAENIVLRDALKKYAKHFFTRKNVFKLLLIKPDIIKRSEEVVKLLEEDIKVLKEIVIKGKEAIIAANNAIRFYNSKRKLTRYLDQNATLSLEAQNLTKKNDLLSIAIYHASRAIYSRELFVDGSGEHIKTYKKDFLIRVNRNKLILEAAIKEAKELAELYRISKEIVECIHEYGDDKYVLENTYVRDGTLYTRELKELPKEVVPYDLDPDTIEDYFSKGNFSYPYVESKKAILYLHSIKCTDKTLIQRIVKINKRARAMRRYAIETADKWFSTSKIRDKLKVKELINESIKLGREGKYNQSIKLVKKAHQISPNNEMVIYGLATLNLFKKNMDECLNYFKILISKYPDNLRYQYEYGNALLSVDPEKGIRSIQEVMKRTTEFDHYFRHIGKYYYLNNDFYQAALNYQEYVDRFPADYDALKALADCYRQLEDYDNWVKTWKQIEGLTGEKTPHYKEEYLVKNPSSGELLDQRAEQAKKEFKGTSKI